MRYLPLTAEDREDMLAAIGVPGIERPPYHIASSPLLSFAHRKGSKPGVVRSC